MFAHRTAYTPQTKRTTAATTAARNTQKCARWTWVGPKTFRHNKPMLPTLQKKSSTSLHTGAMRPTREEGISSHSHILNGSPARPTHTSTTKIRLSVAISFIAVHSHVYLPKGESFSRPRRDIRSRHKRPPLTGLIALRVSRPCENTYRAITDGGTACNNTIRNNLVRQAKSY
jgi:hypothetical protein